MGIVIRFETLPGESPSQDGDRCSDTFQCGAPVSSGAFIRKASPACDGEAGPCALQLRFPLEFRGNQENIADVGLFNAPTPVVYWFAGEADTECRPWLDDECGQIGVCGLPSGKISADFIETFLQLGSASCVDPTPGQTGEFSILAASCPSRFSCPKRIFDAGTVNPEAVQEALGCIDPPKDDCENCTSCVLPGVPGDGIGPRTGGAELGAGGGAFLYYAAGAAGHPGFPGSAAWTVTLGRYWSHDYAERIVPFPDEERVFLVTRKAVFREWSAPDVAGVYTQVSPSSEERTLTWLGVGAGWSLRDLDGTVDLFDASGRWLSRTDRNGNATVGTYAAGELASVAFPDERREDFTYYPPGDPSDGKLESITEVGIDGLTVRTWVYLWSGDDLVRVERPDGTALVFQYGVPGLPGYLTRIELEGTDGTSVRVLRGYEYSPEGRVARTWRGDVSPTGSDAVDVWGLELDDPDEPTTATVTDPLGQVITYTLGRDTVSSNVKVLEIEGDCPVCGLGPKARLEYDDPAHPMLPTRILDGLGTATALVYDAFGQVTERTEADGEAGLQRTTFYTYDPTYPALLTSSSQPSVAGGASTRETVWLRNAAGDATDRTISGSEAGSAFAYTTVTGYNGAGEPLTIDPPGFGASDVTSFTYDPARGHLVAETRTDPLVGTTTFGHDAFNRRTSVLDPNGVETKTSYDELDRVTEVRQVGASPPTDDLVTDHALNVFGDLFRTTLPEGNVIEYGYDAAGRLVSVERKPDAATHGERVVYELDGAGNRTLETRERWDADAQAWVTFSSTEFVFANRCQVERIVQAPGSEEEAVTAFAYDCNGNLEHQWDPNHDPETDPPTTSYGYDALDRLTFVSQPWAGGGLATTSYGYDEQDHLTSVTDAEGNVTTYTYSDRDLLTFEVSQAFVTAGSCSSPPVCQPGCGCTSRRYNDHGALTLTTDARGVTVGRTVDELDRVTAVDYPDDTLDTVYTYDLEPLACAGAGFPLGRLGAIARDGEAVEYCYDRFGRLTRDGELLFAYDGNGNRVGAVYPGGVAAAYGFDFADREVSLEVTTPAGGVVPETVVSEASYFPGGPLATLALGSGTVETRGFDGRYAPTGISLAGVLERTFTYETDRVGNVLEVVELGGCAPGPLLLEAQTVTTEETFASCTTIEAGNGFAVESPGDVAFFAQGTIALKDGFSVGVGGRFVAASGALPELSRRSYGYQPPQYFLTGADGPWGELDWTYDKISNRLSESRDGASPDAYQYLANGSGGNTPVLDQVTLGIGGSRDYTWGAAGHLEEVAAGANVLDFGADSEGRLSGVNRTAAGETAAFAYDGRSFLRRAEETAGGTSSVEPLYDSAGLVHGLRRRAAPADPEELVVFFYLAGRPVAQLVIDGTGAESWTYLSTDHLETPLLATDESGLVVWEGGFEPFGQDYQQGTPAGALEAAIHLRLPGQWEDSTWTDATSGARLYYNLARWLEPTTGRYTRPDPAGSLGEPHPYLYARANPVLISDLLGLKSRACCTPITGGLLGTFKHCFIEIEDEQRNKETQALHGMGTPRRDWGGPIGCTFPNDPFDRRAPRRPGYECGPWNEDCPTDECVKREAANYPRASAYKLTGPNSNSFAGNIARACGLQAPPVVGWQTPGWGDSPPPGLYIPTLHGGLRPFPCPQRR